MRAVDTNVVVRFIVGDGGDEAERARQVFAAGDVFVPTTVMLETEWVLRSTYRNPPQRIVAALRSLFRLPGLVCEDAVRVALALEWAEAGLDFADAFHLAGARDCTAFVSFDRPLARVAARLDVLPVVAP